MIRDPDALRTVWLFGKPYFWTRLPGGHLTLVPALPPVPQPVTSLAETVMTMLAGPLPDWQSKEQPMPTIPCTATIDGRHVLGGGPVQCTREAGHPENHVGPKRGDYGRTLWTDHSAGATPCGAASGEQH